MPRSILLGESKTARFVATFAAVCAVYLFLGWAFFKTPLVRQIPGMLGAAIAIGLVAAFRPRAPEKKG